MSNHFDISSPFDPSQNGSTPANDNLDWMADHRLAARMFSECRLRYLKINPETLSLKGRIHRANLLRRTLEMIRFAWQELSR
jgi:hypothetical protein